MHNHNRPSYRRQSILVATACAGLALASCTRPTSEQSEPSHKEDCVSVAFADATHASLRAIIPVSWQDGNPLSNDQAATDAANFVNTGGCVKQGDQFYDGLVAEPPTDTICTIDSSAPKIGPNSVVAVCTAAIRMVSARPTTNPTPVASPS